MESSCRYARFYTGRARMATAVLPTGFHARRFGVRARAPRNSARPQKEPRPVDEEFYRMKRLPPYVIAEVNAMRATARAGGRDIIDLGMGNPDLPPPRHVIDKLCEVAMKPSAHGYSASRGIPGVRKAQANYYARRFGVDLDPETEVVMTLG
jgi:DNA-binding transcriptional MocR family regulator